MSFHRYKQASHLWFPDRGEGLEPQGGLSKSKDPVEFDSLLVSPTPSPPPPGPPWTDGGLPTDPVLDVAEGDYVTAQQLDPMVAAILYGLWQGLGGGMTALAAALTTAMAEGRSLDLQACLTVFFIGFVGGLGFRAAEGPLARRRATQVPRSRKPARIRLRFPSS